MTATPDRPCILCGGAPEFLYRRSGFRIVRCRECRLVYTGRVPPAGELEALYSESFFSTGKKFSGEKEGPGVRNASARIAEIMTIPGVVRGRWLDVGCATGDFLEAAAPHVNEVVGLDVSEHAVGMARSRGLPNVHVGDFVSASELGEDFDVVTMWDFIEHVPDPAAALEKAHALLRPGGHLVLTTGDVESLVARVTGRFWHLMIPPKHLYFFSPATILRLFTGAGFSPPEVRYPGKRVPLDMVVWKAATLVSPSAGPAALRLSKLLRLGSVAPFVNLFDTMTIVGRREPRRSSESEGGQGLAVARRAKADEPRRSLKSEGRNLRASRGRKPR